MTEPYVRVTIDAVEAIVPLESVCLFWEWLADYKYPGDNHNLTEQRALEIRRNIKGLYAEFLGQEGEA